MMLDEVMRCIYCSMMRYCPYWNNDPRVIGCEVIQDADFKVRRNLRVIVHGSEAWEEADDE